MYVDEGTTRTLSFTHFLYVYLYRTNKNFLIKKMDKSNGLTMKYGDDKTSL